MFYQRLFEALARHDVRYLLVGGLAVNLHGIPRMTMDVALVIAVDPENVDHFIATARELALDPVLPVALVEFADPKKRNAWIKQRNLVAFALRAQDPTHPPSTWCCRSIWHSTLRTIVGLFATSTVS